MTSPQNNYLLESLPGKACEQIIQSSELTELKFGEVLCEPGRPYKHVYFPLTSFISLMEIVPNHPPLEVGLIGNEGMVGITLILSIKEAPLHVVVQGPGTAYKMPAQKFTLALRENPSLLRMLNRYLFVTMAQLSQTAACTHFHEVEARLARWLLMTHDRAHADHFHLTHQYLADMLGVQRSAVTIAAGMLQQRNIINYTRGEINVLDRKSLEAVSCVCYAATNAAYAKQFA
ncbi:MAG: Crp/Fnr family transcriptional regulator [Gammaproteobacteria bacterium]